MPTRQGWMVAAASMALVGGGRLFGLLELYLLGAGMAALVMLAVGFVNMSRLHLDLARHLHPPRVHAGSPCQVALRIRNRGRRRTPALSLHDPVSGGRRASVAVAPLGAGEEASSYYHLPTERRGILAVGPLEVEITDPFGLAAVRSPAAPRVEVTVYPTVDEVPSLPHALGDDPHAGTDHPNALVVRGEDFHALRPYVTGDDLRRVHWRSTARRGDLVVRQDEMPWQGRATVVLDDRSTAHSEASFELAVSGAASVVLACSARRFLLRLVTTTGDDTGFAIGAAHAADIMEHLAVASLHDPGRLTSALSRQPSSARDVLASLEESGRLSGVLAELNRPGVGVVAALVGGGVGADVVAFARLRGAAVVCFDPGPGQGPQRLPAGVAVVDRTTDFPAAWRAALDRRRRMPTGGAVRT